MLTEAFISEIKMILRGRRWEHWGNISLAGDGGRLGFGVAGRQSEIVILKPLLKC